MVSQFDQKVYPIIQSTLASDRVMRRGSRRSWKPDDCRCGGTSRHGRTERRTSTQMGIQASPNAAQTKKGLRQPVDAATIKGAAARAIEMPICVNAAPVARFFGSR